MNMQDSIGVHVSSEGDASVSVFQAISAQHTATQLYIANPRKIGAFSVSDEELNKIASLVNLSEGSMSVFVHAPLSISLTKSVGFSKFSAYQLITHLEMIDRMGGKGLVTHIGSTRYCELEGPWATRVGPDKLEMIHAALRKVANSVHSCSSLLLENSASSKSASSDLDFLCSLVEPYQNTPTKIRLCFDTCHAYAANLFPTKDSRIWGFVDLLHFNAPGSCRGSNRDVHLSTLDTPVMLDIVGELPDVCRVKAKIIEKTNDADRDVALARKLFGSMS